MLETSRLYAARFSPGMLAEKAELWRVLVEAHFRRYVRAESTVLDLGAGSCELINAVRARRRIAVDINPAVVRHAGPGVEAHVAELEALDTIVAEGSVDLVFASNVFEHLESPDRLISVLGEVRRVLVPGGRLCILQPNIRFVGGAFWDFVDHRLPLTEKGMVEALELAGLEVETVRPRFLPYTTKSRLPMWPVLVRAYLAFKPAQWILGKQMLIIAVRPR